MRASLGQRLLAPVAEVRREEVVTALLMFAYAFLAMSSYNIVKPITRSTFISDLGADNLPYVLLAVGALIGVVMTGYTWITSRLPRRWGLPLTQAAMVLMLLAFWVLFQTPRSWVSVAFFFAGKILGLLLISQFWTLANLVYDARQAKRLFGFIGGGAPLGGIAGSMILTGYATRMGTNNLLLISAALLASCAGVVVLIVARERTVETAEALGPTRTTGVGPAEAFRLLRQSKHLQIIAMVIGLAAVGAAIIDQQLNMAAAAQKGQAATDAITSFLGQVQLWTSLIGLVIQVWLTSRIHRFLGLGFALLVLPVALGATATLMLLNAALWAPALARVTDQSLRYTVDKTTREILFVPLPFELKYTAKSFVDVTVDRIAQGFTAVLLLVLIKPWGLGLDWQRLGLASLTIMLLWIIIAVRARRGYLAAFRRSLEEQRIRPAEMRLAVADLSTVETLMEELASPDERRVLYAIDVLESLDKRTLVTPLLIHHQSAAVRARALGALGSMRPEIARQWLDAIGRMLGDADPAVRAAALSALGRIQGREAADIVRPYLEADDARLAATAAAVLAGHGSPADARAAERTMGELARDTRPSAAPARREVAVALRNVADPRLLHLLVPLLYDQDPEVAAEAMRTVRTSGASDFLFVPTLVALLGHRRLKRDARDVLVGYGEPVLDALAHFLGDQEEDRWVRRHLPATIGRIPSQRAMDILLAALGDPDGFLRYKVIAALGRLRREHPDLTFDPAPIARRALAETRGFYNYLSLHHNLFVRGNLPADALLARALEDKIARARDRIFKLLELLYPWKDIAAARWALEHGDARASSSAAELLDNTLELPMRKQIMPVVEDLPLDERVRTGNIRLGTRPRDVEETLLQLINDDDPVVAAAAINLVRTQRIWTLADDIEYVLAHRDAEDWHVFEAASLALADRRMPVEQRRALWLEPLPSIELADRIRRLPMFETLWTDELVRIADAGHQVRREPGRTLFVEGAVPDSLELLLDGRMSGQRGTDAPRTIEAPAAIGLEEVLEGSPMPETIRAIEACVSLAIPREVCQSLLADNTDLVQGLFRTLIDQSADLATRVVQPGGDPAVLGSLARGSLSEIERVMVLQRVELFSTVAGDELLELASIAREVRIDADARVFGPADAPAVWIVVAGAISLETLEGPATSARAGDTVGLYAALAGQAIDRTAHAIRPGFALRIDGDDLFDLLSQRDTLLEQLFASLFRTRTGPSG